MEQNACILDPQRVNEEYERTVDEYKRASAELSKITGGVNLRSAKQKLWLLYEKLGFEPPKDPRTKQPIQTDKGVLSTTVDTLALLKPKNKEQQDFLRLYTRANKLNSLLTKNLNFFKGVVDEYAGEFRGIVNQGFTRTGRLSSSGRQLYFAKEKKTRGTQLHNQPREYKKLFFAPGDEWLCGEADGSQLEFRVGAQLSLDPVAIDEIENGADVHAFTAEVLTEAGEPGFAQLSFGERRQRAKPQTFSPINC
jgi:DNA polymerase I-like protein with 3'-5' exonuclease and polymerase domains